MDVGAVRDRLVALGSEVDLLALRVGNLREDLSEWSESDPAFGALAEELLPALACLLEVPVAFREALELAAEPGYFDGEVGRVGA